MAPFFSGLLACVWLGENLALFQIIAMVCCFAGIIVIVTAPAAASKVTDTGDVEEVDSFSTSHAGIVLCFICVLLFATAGVATRRIR